MLAAPRQVIALLELPTMQLAGNKGAAMSVDSMSEVDTTHANLAVVAALKPPFVQMVPLLHATPREHTCTTAGRGGSSSYPKIYPENRNRRDRLRWNA